MDIVNLIVMGVLTFMVYWATRSSAKAGDRAAQAAEASIRLSKQIYEHQQEEKRKASFLRKKLIINLMEKVIKAIEVESSGFLDGNNFKQTPLDYGLSKDELGTFFELNDIQLILEFWSQYNKYLDDHWKYSNGSWIESDQEVLDLSKMGNATIELGEILLDIKGQFESE